METRRALRRAAARKESDEVGVHQFDATGVWDTEPTVVQDERITRVRFADRYSQVLLDMLVVRSAGDDAAAFLFAGYGACIIDACVNEHHDVAIAVDNFADLMRQYAPPDSDFPAQTADFMPVAEEILYLYVLGATGFAKPNDSAPTSADV